ncbi:MAG: hypothetical protein AAFX00_11170, partial [Pseudomonadota bacterium]
MHVLIVHDSLPTAEKIALRMQQAGLEVRYTDSVHGATAELRAGETRVLVLKQIMFQRHTTGIALAAEYRNPNVATVLLSDRPRAETTELFEGIPSLVGVLPDLPNLDLLAALAASEFTPEMRPAIRTEKPGPETVRDTAPEEVVQSQVDDLGKDIDSLHSLLSAQQRKSAETDATLRQETGRTAHVRPAAQDRRPEEPKVPREHLPKADTKQGGLGTRTFERMRRALGADKGPSEKDREGSNAVQKAKLRAAQLKARQAAEDAQKKSAGQTSPQRATPASTAQAMHTSAPEMAAELPRQRRTAADSAPHGAPDAPKSAPPAQLPRRPVASNGKLNDMGALAKRFAGAAGAGNLPPETSAKKPADHTDEQAWVRDAEERARAKAAAAAVEQARLSAYARPAETGPAPQIAFYRSAATSPTEEKPPQVPPGPNTKATEATKVARDPAPRDPAGEAQQPK